MVDCFDCLTSILNLFSPSTQGPKGERTLAVVVVYEICFANMVCDVKRETFWKCFSLEKKDPYPKSFPLRRERTLTVVVALEVCIANIVCDFKREIFWKCFSLRKKDPYPKSISIPRFHSGYDTLLFFHKLCYANALFVPTFYKIKPAWQIIYIYLKLVTRSIYLFYFLSLYIDNC